MSVINIKDRQTQYALRKFKCVVPKDDNNIPVGKVKLTIERPFLFLGCYNVDKNKESDKDANMSQGFDNSLLYLYNHPVVDILTVANVTAFHISAGQYLLNDTRDNAEQELYAFVLLCTNY